MQPSPESNRPLSQGEPLAGAAAPVSLLLSRIADQRLLPYDRIAELGRTWRANKRNFGSDDLVLLFQQLSQAYQELPESRRSAPWQVHEAARSIERQLPNLQPVLLGRCAVAASLLGMKRLVEAAASQARATIERAPGGFDFAALADIRWACARSGINDRSTIDVLDREAARNSTARDLHAANQAIRYQWSAACSKSLNPSLAARFFPLIEENVSRIPLAGLSDYTWSLLQMRSPGGEVQDGSLPRELEIIREDIKARVPALAPGGRTAQVVHQITNITGNLLKLTKADRGLAQAVERFITAHHAQARTEDLVAFAFECAVVGHLPITLLSRCSAPALIGIVQKFRAANRREETFLKAVADAALEKIQQFTGAEGNLSMLQGLKELNIRPERFLAALAKNIAAGIDSYTFTQCCRIGTCFLRLGVRDPVLMGSIVARLTVLLPTSDPRSWPELVLFQAEYGCDFFLRTVFPRPSEVARPKAAKPKPAQKNPCESFAASVGEAARRLGLDPRVDVELEGYSVDLVIEMEGTTVIVNCNGENFHRAGGKGGPLKNSDIRRNQHFISTGKKVIDVEDRQWFAPETNQVELLRSLLDGLK